VRLDGVCKRRENEDGKRTAREESWADDTVGEVNDAVGRNFLLQHCGGDLPEEHNYVGESFQVIVAALRVEDKLNGIGKNRSE
jgi:hypothetical protein